MSEVKRYGVHYEDLHDGVESSEDNGVVSMVQTSDHLAAMEALREAKDREIEGLKAMLRKHQWIPDDFSDDLSCPECLNGEIDGHAEDCALAKLIGEPK